MIQNMRDKTGSWLTIIITIVVILTFALWGVQRLFVSGSTNTPVAKVNGVKISQQELYVAWQQMKRQKQQELGAKFYADPILPQKLKKQALDMLVKRTILIHHLHKQGYYVGRMATSEAIYQMPAFQVNGQFSSSRFVQLSTAQGYTQKGFFDAVSQALMAEQLYSGIAISQFLSIDQARPLLLHLWQQRQFSSVVLKPEQFVNQVNITQADINQYYKSHSDQFRLPEQVSIEYIQLAPATLTKAIKPTKAELNQFYQQHREQFGKDSTYEQVEDNVRSAYIRQQVEKQFNQQRDNLANLIYEHPDSLQPAAKALNVSVQTSDFFTRQPTDKGITKDRSVINAAFSDAVLKQGENSDVIPLSDGSILVMRLKAHKASQEKPLASVHDTIVKQLKQQKAAQLAKKTAQQVVAAVKSGKSLQQVAQQYHVTWQSNGFVTYDNQKVNPELLQQVFLLSQPTKNKLSVASVELANNTYGVVALQAVKAYDHPLSKEEQSKYMSQIIKAKGSSLIALYQQSLLEQAKVHYYKAAIESLH